MPAVFWTIVGAVAAILTSFGFVPQVAKMWQRRSVGDVSIVTLMQFTAGVCLWALYGLSRQDPVIITANVVTLVTLIVGLTLFFRFKSVGAEGAILGTLRGAEAIGADVAVAAHDSAHGLVKGVAESGGDVVAAARGAVEEALESAKARDIVVPVEQATAAVAAGVVEAAAEVDATTAEAVKRVVEEVIGQSDVTIEVPEPVRDEERRG